MINTACLIIRLSLVAADWQLTQELVLNLNKRPLMIYRLQWSFRDRSLRVALNPAIRRPENPLCPGRWTWHHDWTRPGNFVSPSVVCFTVNIDMWCDAHGETDMWSDIDCHNDDMWSDLDLSSCWSQKKAMLLRDWKSLSRSSFLPLSLWKSALRRSVVWGKME
jgi:hypothetical protein